MGRSDYDENMGQFIATHVLKIPITAQLIIYHSIGDVSISGDDSQVYENAVIMIGKWHTM